MLKPPGDFDQEIRNKGALLLQILWIIIQIIPAIIYSCICWLFPGDGKCLKGKTALVTGAARGLGRGIAIELGRAGCQVACVDINLPGAEETAKLINDELCYKAAFAYKTNVAKVNEINELFKNVTADIGPVTYLVNNASVIVGCKINENKVNDLQVKAAFEINLLSYVYMIRTFLPDMRERKEGHIIAIASVASFMGTAYATVYSACKWGIRGLMESIRAELKREGDDNIHLTCVHPYFINTSNDYLDFWDLRIPPLTIEEVVEEIMKGIKYEYFTVTIPSVAYYAINFLKLLPLYIQDQFFSVCYTNIKPPEAEKWNSFPTLGIIDDTVKTKTQ